VVAGDHAVEVMVMVDWWRMDYDCDDAVGMVVANDFAWVCMPVAALV
jgi:hypothetical protein